MSDYPKSTRPLPTDHPLRESALVALSTEERDTLVRAAVLVDHAIHEFTPGEPGAISERKLACALEADALYLVEATRAELDGWTGTSPVRRAVEEALDGFAAAYSALSAVLKGGPE